MLRPFWTTLPNRNYSKPGTANFAKGTRSFCQLFLRLLWGFFISKDLLAEIANLPLSICAHRLDLPDSHLVGLDIGAIEIDYLAHVGILTRWRGLGFSQSTLYQTAVLGCSR